MSSLSQDDIDTLASIGHDTVQTIVALVVEAIMYSECSNPIEVAHRAHLCYSYVALYFVLVVIAGRLLLYVS